MSSELATTLGCHSYGLLQKCTRKTDAANELIEKTAAVLNDDAVSLMLIGVQRDNLELSVRMALNR